MPKVKVNDINIYYEIHGDGYPLIMIIGLSANADWWDPNLKQELSKHYKTIVFDNRGTGRTDENKDEYSIKTMADDTIGLMNALNIERAHILGVSMGGMIAQELFFNYPERVEKLVLCSTNCGGANQVPASLEILQILTRDRTGQSTEEILQSTINLLFTEDFIKNNAELIEYAVKEVISKNPISPSVYNHHLVAMAKFDSYERLKTINTPTLIFHGKEDVLIPPKNAEILAEKISGAKLVLLDNTAHAIFSQAFEKVIKTLYEFLK